MEIIVKLFLLVGFLATGCGSGFGDDICDKIYDECNMYTHLEHRPQTKDECVDLYDSLARINKPAKEKVKSRADCVREASCSELVKGACGVGALKTK